MTAVEAISETFTQAAPNSGLKVIEVQATTVNAGDFVTVQGLTTIRGWYGRSDDTIAAGSNATNIITLTNGATGTKIWSFLVWGE